ncbi:unnamed protein product, partial [Phaeothamnion confervicola]
RTTERASDTPTTRWEDGEPGPSDCGGTEKNLRCYVKAFLLRSRSCVRFLAKAYHSESLLLGGINYGSGSDFFSASSETSPLHLDSLSNCVNNLFATRNFQPDGSLMALSRIKRLNLQTYRP